jgi:cell division septation protein DedD
VVVTEPAPRPQEIKDDAIYEVQVGAFTEQGDAQWVLEQLQERYPNAYSEPRDGPLGRYYRVRLGPFQTEEQAEKVARILKRQGHRIFVDELPAPVDLEQAQAR